MATISAFTESGNEKFYKKVVSDAATLATSDIVELSGLPDAFRKVSIGVQMFDVSLALTLGSAGTFVVKYKTVNTEQWETHTSSIDATAPATLELEKNVTAIQISDSSVAGCVTWKAVLTFNKR